MYKVQTKKVFVVNASGHDFSPAKRFGELYFLTQGSGNRFNVDRLSAQIEKSLKISSPQDFLLLSGTMVYNSIAFYLWMKKHKQCNLLIWSPLKGIYILRTYTERGVSHECGA